MGRFYAALKFLIWEPSSTTQDLQEPRAMQPRALYAKLLLIEEFLVSCDHRDDFACNFFSLFGDLCCLDIHTQKSPKLSIEHFELSPSILGVFFLHKGPEFGRQVNNKLVLISLATTMTYCPWLYGFLNIAAVPLLGLLFCIFNNAGNVGEAC